MDWQDWKHPGVNGFNPANPEILIILILTRT